MLQTEMTLDAWHPELSFYERWGMSDEEAKAVGADLNGPPEFGEILEDPRAMSVEDQDDLDDLSLNESRDHLRIVTELIKLDPLLMKNN